MKIEMGESLFYSWLRHVKDCQLVQTNWKPSAKWNLLHEEELDILVKQVDQLFQAAYGYNIFKQNASMLQIIQQGECDVLGISFQSDGPIYYAVDVAFHEDGLNYGTKDETVMKVISKVIRTAICLYGFFNTRKGDIIFASPKINPSVLDKLQSCLIDANKLLRLYGYEFDLRLIANQDFEKSVLEPILLASDGIADTTELFVRSYQMYKMFSRKSVPVKRGPRESQALLPKTKVDIEINDPYPEFKIGKLAQVVLRQLLESGAATKEEIRFMQTLDYSKQFFHLNYPLLVRTDSDYEAVRYYVSPLVVDGVSYRLCSQWFETEANNDRPHLLKWIKDHTSSEMSPPS